MSCTHWVFKTFLLRCFFTGRTLTQAARLRGFAVLLLLLYLTTFSLVNGQQKTAVFLKNFTTEQGLPSEYVSKVVQGTDGFIWFGTNNGLVRYDGYNFVVYSHNPRNASSISGDYISAIEPMNERLMWVGVYEKGLDLFDTQSGKTVFHIDEKTTPRLPDNRILKLWVEKDKNRLWVCTMKNHFFWIDLRDFKATVPKPIKHPMSSVIPPETNSIYAIEQNKEQLNQYWMATNDGLLLYDENLNTAWYHQVPETQETTATSNRMRAMLVDGDKIWLGSRGGSGLTCFDIPTRTFTSFPYNKLTDPNFVLAIRRKSATEFWIGSIGASLLIFNTETKQYTYITYDTKRPSDIRSDIIFDIAVDKQGNTWLATKHGVALYNDDYQLFIADSLLKPTVTKQPNFFKIWSIEEDEKSLYFGCAAADGLLIYDRKTKKQRVRRPLGLRADETMYIYRMAKDQAGKIWLAALTHLCYYDPKTDKFTWIQRPELMGEALVHSVAVGADQRVYFGTRSHGLFSYDPAEDRWVNHRTATSAIVSDSYLHDLLVDRFGKLWISTGGGISVYDTQQGRFVRNYTAKDGFKAIFKLALDERNRLWTTSENDGVKCIDTQTLRVLPSITKQQGLLSNTVDYVEIDKHQNLWITTHRGLCVYNLAAKSALLFDAKNGLPVNQIEGATKALKNGFLVQAFSTSFAIIDPTKLTDIRVTNPPTFTYFKIFDLRYPIRAADTLRLKHTQNFFSIGFSALNFSQPEKLVYQYQLVGVDDNWVIANELRMASYTNVTSGEYLFKTRYAVKGTSFWSPEQQVWIIIKPPFWKTWWFGIVVLAASLAIVYYVYSLQINKVRKTEALKTETNRQLAALEMKALRSQMNPHFIFNSLNSIKYYVIRNETAVASRYLSQFSKLIRRILTNSETDLVKLSEELEMIRLYLEMEQLRFGDKLAYEIEVDERLDTEMIEIPTMLIQPYIENAIWHGIMHKVSPGKLYLSLRETATTSERLEITVSDDGIGRRKSKELQAMTPVPKKSLGMRITKERIELLNQFHKKNIELTIADLNPGTEDTGTCVRLIVDITA